MKIFRIILIFLFSLNAHSECRSGIVAIFKSSTIEEISQSIGGVKAKVGESCKNSIGLELNSDSYCECISKNQDTDFDVSRKMFRQKNGKALKSIIFDLAETIAVNDNPDLTLNCKLHDTLVNNCDAQMISEMFPEYEGTNFSQEMFADYLEIFNVNSGGGKKTIDHFRSNSCSSTFVRKSSIEGNTASVQAELDKSCEQFTNQVIGLCQNESLTGVEYDNFDFDLPTLENVDSFNYFCKIKDRPIKDINTDNNTLSNLFLAYEKKDEEVSPLCKEVCIDEAPYSVRGCQVDTQKAIVALKRLIASENVNNEEITFLKEIIGNQVSNDVIEGKINDDDLAYFKKNLDDDDYNNIVQIVKTGRNQASVNQQDSLVSQFFATEKSEAVSTSLASSDKTRPAPAQSTAAPQEQSVQQIQQQMMDAVPEQQAAMNTSTQSMGPSQNRALTFGRRGKSNNASRATKDIVASVKALREAGSSLASALDAQKKRLKREREKIARENQDKYQRYDAETLEPIQRGRRGRGSNGSANYPIANVASTGSGGGSNFATGGGGSSSTGSSTFTQPEKKATVVDITGRSAPNIDLNNLQSSGATLPASITNHPDASEISKMFNGLAYEKDEKGRSIASEKGEVKKIKVSWGAESIDLGSLLINAKDLKPGEEFIVYKGDMDKFVRLTPAYRFQAGKRVFIGYRVENRNRKNADLAASLYAKKFLIL
ncbi:hypothetical protein ABMA79_03975 [Halobacteriovorax sp. HFRX-2_2]|uniref:hypothetical protein n=1 Tax=unclassified Halobacteriovorax TaxID=2639665 RepID=UPI00371C7FA4